MGYLARGEGRGRRKRAWIGEEWVNWIWFNMFYAKHDLVLLTRGIVNCNMYDKIFLVHVEIIIVTFYWTCFYFFIYFIYFVVTEYSRDINNHIYIYAWVLTYMGIACTSYRKRFSRLTCYSPWSPKTKLPAGRKAVHSV